MDLAWQSRSNTLPTVIRASKECSSFLFAYHMVLRIVEPTNREFFRVLMVGALPVDLRLVKGGVEAVIINLLEGFGKLDHIRVTHLAFSKEIVQEKTVTVSSNVAIRFVPFASRFELLDYVINSRTLDRIIEEVQPHVIHIQEITPQILRFIRFSTTNIIVTQHGIMREELKYTAGAAQRMKGLFKAGIERIVFPQFRNIIFISAYSRRMFRGQPAHETTIFNPVNPIFFQTPSSADQSGNSILYAGILSRRKNIGIVVNALAAIKSRGFTFQLHVAGGFKDVSYQREIMTLIDKSGLNDFIRFHGWLKQDEVASLSRMCPLFILPSRQETLPVSIAEAMAQGRIVIASDVGAVSEMFTDGESGYLFRKDDTDDLIRVLVKVFSRKAGDDVGARAREEALSKFHPDRIVRETLQFYRQVHEDTMKEGVPS